MNPKLCDWGCIGLLDNPVHQNLQLKVVGRRFYDDRKTSNPAIKQEIDH
jgi:hypothetical protein